ncbi:Hypothetical protein ORPV_243 [Orpheovirus IHUMI-LCC2]|uniref:MORN-repeat protein n=1 Tax=Orpheovirus IHUMI-LCC2 TaxID=2023057 RepID=A0A2I2L3R2_9VIRU|nr:Hypothetical protein ORPV_243 [Orpheovirus IHUMI-LCC2]SNW62147.1 Hypothetical protein ORPV_243 [Orpheovirus IHUMI-LCC2]
MNLQDLIDDVIYNICLVDMDVYMSLSLVNKKFNRICKKVKDPISHFCEYKEVLDGIYKYIFYINKNTGLKEYKEEVWCNKCLVSQRPHIKHIRYFKNGKLHGKVLGYSYHAGENTLILSSQNCYKNDIRDGKSISYFIPKEYKNKKEVKFYYNGKHVTFQVVDKDNINTIEYYNNGNIIKSIMFDEHTGNIIEDKIY